MFGLGVWLLSFGFGLLWLRTVKGFDAAIRFKDNHRHFKWIFMLGVVSAFASWPLYSAIEWLSWRVGATEVDSFWTYYDILVVGPAEEGAKLLITLLAVQLFGKVREPLDVMIKAMVVSLGFATIENVYYGFQYTSLELVFFRSFLTSWGHMAYSAIWGYALGDYLAGKRYGLERPVHAVPFFLGLAALVHGIYNFIPSLAGSISFAVVELVVAGLILRRLVTGSPFRDFKAHESKSMLPVLELALRANEDNPVLNFRYGKALLWERRYAEAATAFTQVLTLSPKSRAGRLYLGITETLQGDPQGRKHVDLALRHKGRRADDTLRRILARSIKNREERQQVKTVLLRPAPPKNGYVPTVDSRKIRAAARVVSAASHLNADRIAPRSG